MEEALYSIVTGPPCHRVASVRNCLEHKILSIGGDHRHKSLRSKDTLQKLSPSWLTLYGLVEPENIVKNQAGAWPRYSIYKWGIVID